MNFAEGIVAFIQILCMNQNWFLVQTVNHKNCKEVAAYQIGVLISFLYLNWAEIMHVLNIRIFNIGKNFSH